MLMHGVTGKRKICVQEGTAFAIREAMAYNFVGKIKMV